MKKSSILAATIIALLSAGCEKQPAEPKQAAEPALAEEQPQALFERKNATQGLDAMFYGEAIRVEGAKPVMRVSSVVLKDARTGQSVTYAPDSDTRQASDFFFADVWSPDGAYLLLPLDKRDGFAIFKASSAMQDVPAQKYADTIRVWRGEARRYWHGFEAWEGPAAFRFKGELEGRVFHFRYDIPTRRLTCFEARCASADHARNLAGDVTPLESDK